MEPHLFGHGIWSQKLRGQGSWICLLIVMMRTLTVLSDTIPQEAVALVSMAQQWQNAPRNWKDFDPCGSNWTGITCSNSHVVTITLSNFGLNGSLAGDIQSLVELLSLDLSYNQGLGGSIPASIGNLRKLKTLILVGCSFSGFIPPELGKLERLNFLGLNANKFRGSIPGSLGNLSQLYWFDITDNEISGTLPVSDGVNLGLDLLTKAKHWHFGKNKLSGQIPAKLFHSDMILLHVLFDNNNFSGTIPPTIGLVTTLEAIRLDGNYLTGSVPSNLNNLTNMAELLLSNNGLTGPLPNLTGMNALAYVDLSNNSFDESQVPQWFTTLPSMTTLLLEYLTVSGQIPTGLFSYPPLQTTRLRNNHFNGTLNISTGYSSQLQIIDLQNNKIDGFNNRGGYSNELILIGNPVCNQGGSSDSYCKAQQQSTPSYSTPTSNCVSLPCPPGQVLSPNCTCGYPFAGTIHFRLQTISNLGNFSYFRAIEANLMSSFQKNQIPVDSVSLRNPFMDPQNYLDISLQFFPAGKTRFDAEDVIKIGNLFSNQTFKAPSFLGPYYFIAEPYFFIQEAAPGSKSNNMAAVIGASVAGAVLVLILTGVIFYVMRQKKKLEKVVEQSRGYGSFNPSRSSGSIPQLTGPRWFSFEELKKCTNNFSEANGIGSGGYGKVYRGTLVNGQLVAVKRSEEGSMQGGLEFKTEVELLSRVHHRNLVSLVGFCSDQVEQMLVYEYVPNGNLKESLSGQSGVHLDWKKRLQVALDAARGLAYLHHLCNPPIIHRDVKSNNILLDDHLNAKVSDFGLSKPLGDKERGYVTTQVKGTAGYVDPEYYMTQQLTEKSDVYSFGVVLLELITARKPIERGKYIVREVRNAMDKNKDLYGVLDPVIGLGTTLSGFENLMNLAMRCVDESSEDRPTMNEVVKEIENIMQLAGINPNAESTSTSHDGTSRTRGHPYSNEALSDYSWDAYPRRVEPK